jgi:tetratricopeptide (TPR) repeat protein
MVAQIIAFSILAQVSTIYGQIRDAKTRAPLNGVRIVIQVRGVPVSTALTDVDGRFALAVDVSGRVTLSVERYGFDSKTIEVEALDSNALHFDLTPSAAPHQSGAAATVEIRELMAPESARRAFHNAQKRIVGKDCSDATEAIETGLRRFGETAAALTDLGNCYRRLNDLKNAEQAFRRAAALSDSPYIALNLAEVYSSQLRWDDAEIVLKEAAAKNPENGDAYYGLALLYFNQGRLDDAERTALEADSRNHRIADLHLLLARVYARTTAHAVESQLEQYLKEAPKSHHSGRIRAMLKAAKRGP